MSIPHCLLLRVYQRTKTTTARICFRLSRQKRISIEPSFLQRASIIMPCAMVVIATSNRQTLKLCSIISTTRANLTILPAVLERRYHRAPIAGHSSKPSPKHAQAGEAEFPIAQQSQGRGMEHFLSYGSCSCPLLYHLFYYESPSHDPPMPRKSTKIGVIAFSERRPVNFKVKLSPISTNGE